MSEETPDTYPEGAASCVRCRQMLPTGAFFCPACGPAADRAEGRAEPGRALVNSPFVVVFALAVLFGFLMLYNPRRLKQEREAPVPLAGEKILGQDAAELRAWSDEFRRDFIERYGDLPAGPVTPDMLRGMLEEQLRQVDLDPSFTPEQKVHMRQMIDKALREQGY